MRGHWQWRDVIKCQYIRRYTHLEALKHLSETTIQLTRLFRVIFVAKELSFPSPSSALFTERAATGRFHVPPGRSGGPLRLRRPVGRPEGWGIPDLLRGAVHRCLGGRVWFRRGQLGGAVGGERNKVARLYLHSMGGGVAGEELVIFLFRGSGWLGCCGSVGWCPVASTRSCSTPAGSGRGGFSVAEALMLLGLLVLRSLLRGDGVSSDSVVELEMGWWRWGSSDLLRASSAVASIPVRRSLWPVASRLPGRLLEQWWPGKRGEDGGTSGAFLGVRSCCLVVFGPLCNFFTFEVLCTTVVA